MTTKITTDNIQPNTVVTYAEWSDNLLPKVGNVSIANSSYTVLDDTAVNVGGGYIVVTGGGFQDGATVLISGTQATAISYVNSSTLHVQVPAKSAATYNLYVVNPDGGTAIGANKLTYSGTPTWVTASTLANVQNATAFTGTFEATGATSYANTTALPTGFNLVSANGYYYGIIEVQNETTYNFTIRASDNENQESDKSFSLTTTVSTPYRSDALASNLRLALPFDQTYQFSDIAYKISGSPNTTSISQMNSNKVSAISTNRTKWSSFGYTSSFFEDTKASPSCKYTLPTTLDPRQPFTIEGWFYPTGTVSNYWALSSADVGGRFLFEVWSGTETYTLSSTQNSIKLPSGAWYHIAITDQSVYVNGVNKGNNTYTCTGFTVLHVGQFNDTDGNSYLGNIQDLRVYIGARKYSSNFTPGDNSIIQDYGAITPI